MNRSVLSALVLLVAVPGWAKDGVPPAYSFSRPPLAIHEALPDLQVGDVPKLDGDERQLLDQVWQWRTVKRGAADARPADRAALEIMLWASGIQEASAREGYRARFGKVVASAKLALNNARSDRDRGERLMQHLHGGVMHKGYSLDQSSLAAVFDTGEFNCVSSTAMYLLVGQQLGLQLQPISIPGKPYLPGHAALDLVDGKARFQVEPTNPDGFDWATKVKRPGVIVFGFVPDRKDGHATDVFGIAASIYTNRGVELAKGDQPDRLAAIRCNLSALALDPTDPTATNNLLSDFINWGPDLVKEKRFEDAIRVLSFGRSIAPKSNELQDNQAAAYASYIQATLAAGQDREAVELVRRAAKADLDDRDFQSAANWFQQQGEQARDDAGWEAALAVAERGLKLLSDDEAKEMQEWRTGLYRRWSQELLEKQDLDQSLQVLARAYAIDPQDREVHAGIGYHTQQALKLLDQHQDVKLGEQFAALAKQFPNVEDVSEIGWSFAVRSIRKLADDGKFAAAIQARERYSPLVSDAKQQTELGGLPYDLWARKLAGQKQWQAACDKYSEGLQALPGHEVLTRNLAATIIDWAEPEIDAQRWDAAIKIYERGLKDYLPGHRDLTQNLEYCQQKKQGK